MISAGRRSGLALSIQAAATDERFWNGELDRTPPIKTVHLQPTSATISEARPHPRNGRAIAGRMRLKLTVCARW